MIIAKCNKGKTKLSIKGQTNEILAELVVITESTIRELAKEYDNDYDRLLRPYITALLKH